MRVTRSSGSMYVCEGAEVYVRNAMQRGRAKRMTHGVAAAAACECVGVWDLDFGVWVCGLTCTSHVIFRRCPLLLQHCRKLRVSRVLLADDAAFYDGN